MKLRIKQIADGLHPSEVVVEVRAAEGVERLVIDAASIEDGAIDVGAPVGKRNGHYLIELPRETFRGTWRVWVSKKELEDLWENVA